MLLRAAYCEHPMHFRHVRRVEIHRLVERMSHLCRVGRAVLVYVRDWRCDGRSGAYGVTAAHTQLVGKVAGVVGGMAWAAHVKHLRHARDTGRVQNQRPVEIICQLPGIVAANSWQIISIGQLW